MTAIPVKKRKTHRHDVVFPVVNTILLILLMFITLYPVLNTVAYSFNDGTDALRGGIGLTPRVFSTKSYAAILEARKLMAEAEAGKKHIKTVCPHCGKKSAAGMHYCGWCGEALVAEALVEEYN